MWHGRQANMTDKINTLRLVLFSRQFVEFFSIGYFTFSANLEQNLLCLNISNHNIGCLLAICWLLILKILELSFACSLFIVLLSVVLCVCMFLQITFILIGLSIWVPSADTNTDWLIDNIVWTKQSDRQTGEKKKKRKKRFHVDQGPLRGSSHSLGHFEAVRVKLN